MAKRWDGDMSGDRTGPRYDVVATTRRSWTETQKRAIVAEIGVGDATLSEVARRHGIHSSLLFRWRREFGGDAPPVKPEPPENAVRPALSFVPVVVPVTAPSRQPIDPVPARPAMAATIEIVLMCGRVLRVGAEVDTAVLVRVVRALEADLQREGRR
jgi:transposase